MYLNLATKKLSEFVSSLDLYLWCYYNVLSPAKAWREVKGKANVEWVLILATKMYKWHMDNHATDMTNLQG